MWNLGLFRENLIFVNDCFRNPRLAKGGGVLTTPNGLSSIAPKSKTKSKNLSNLFYILCSHFDEKIRGYPLSGGRVSRKSPRAREVVPTWNYFKSQFWKKKICMIWTNNLQNMFETVFPFFKSKNRVKFRYFTPFSEKKKFWPIFHCKSTFLGRPWFITSLWRHRRHGLTDLHDFGINRKKRPYTMVPNNYTLGLSISSSQGVVTTPLRKTCYKEVQEDEG